MHYAAIPLNRHGYRSGRRSGARPRVGTRRFLVGLVAVGAFFTAVSWGISPVSPVYELGFWPLDDGPMQEDLEAAI